jgi:hypothetical protein
MDILWICVVGVGSANVNQRPLVYNEGWMVYGWGTLFHCVKAIFLVILIELKIQCARATWRQGS